GGAARRGSVAALRRRRHLQFRRLSIDGGAGRARRPACGGRPGGAAPDPGAARRPDRRGSAGHLPVPARRSRADIEPRSGADRHRRSAGSAPRLDHALTMRNVRWQRRATAAVWLMAMAAAPAWADDAACPPAAPAPGPGSVDPFRAPAPEATALNA